MIAWNLQAVQYVDEEVTAKMKVEEEEVVEEKEVNKKRCLEQRHLRARGHTAHTHTSPQGLEDKSSGCEHNGTWQRGVARRKEDIAPTSTFLDTTSTPDFEEW